MAVGLFLLFAGMSFYVIASSFYHLGKQEAIKIDRISKMPIVRPAPDSLFIKNSDHDKEYTE
jgi:hypothetical protein